MSSKFLQIQPMKLAGSGVTATATSIIVDSCAFPDGTSVTSSELGTTNYGTLEPNTSREEIFSFTGITQNADGTATLTGVTRGLQFGYPYTADTDLRTAHAGGTVCVISNNPQMYQDLISFDNDETVSGEFTFPAGGNAKAPKSGTVYSAPTDDLELVSKKFVVDTASGTGVSYNKIVVTATAGETVAAGEILYLKTSDQEWYLADASTSATAENIIYGIAQGAGTDGASITGGVLLQGLDENQTGLTAGKQYLSDTAGALSATTGTVEVTMGIAEDATSVIFIPNYDQKLTEDQQDALAGSSGTPSASNKYITADDVTEAKTASKIARRDSNSDILVATTPTAGDAATSKTYVDNAISGVASVDKIFLDYTQHDYTDSTETNTLLTATIPGGSLGTSNGIRAKVLLSNINTNGGTGNVITFYVNYGGTILITKGINIVTALSAHTGYIEVELYSSGATDTQKGSIFFYSAAGGGSNSIVEAQGFAVGTSAEDSTGDLTFSIESKLSTAGSDIVSEMGSIELIQ